MAPEDLRAVGSEHHRGPRSLWRRLLALVVVLVVVAWGIVTVRVFVLPPLGAVRAPQAVVVLGGYGARAERGVAVAERRGVHTLIVSVPPGPRTETCPHSTPTLAVTCFVPDPRSTQGEARTIETLARRYGWHRLLIVAGTTQVVRARVRVSRCYSGQMAFVGVDPSGFFDWVGEVVYDEAAMLKALVWQRSC